MDQISGIGQQTCMRRAEETPLWWTLSTEVTVAASYYYSIFSRLSYVQSQALHHSLSLLLLSISLSHLILCRRNTACKPISSLPPRHQISNYQQELSTTRQHPTEAGGSINAWWLNCQYCCCKYLTLVWEHYTPCMIMSTIQKNPEAYYSTLNVKCSVTQYMFSGILLYSLG